MRNFISITLLGLLALLPQLTFAASCDSGENDTFSEIVNMFLCVSNKTIVPFIFAIAVLVFVIGVVRYMANGSDEEARKKGRDFIVWGLISMTAMVTIWGFVRIAVDALDLKNSSDIIIPEAPIYDPAE